MDVACYVIVLTQWCSGDEMVMMMSLLLECCDFSLTFRVMSHEGPPGDLAILSEFWRSIFQKSQFLLRTNAAADESLLLPLLSISHFFPQP